MKEKVDFKEQILEDFKAGKSLFGKDGTLALMIENIVNVAFESEMDAHLRIECCLNLKHGGIELSMRSIQ